MTLYYSTAQTPREIRRNMILGLRPQYVGFVNAQQVAIEPGACRDAADTRWLEIGSNVTAVLGTDVLGAALSGETRLSLWLVRSSAGVYTAKLAREHRWADFQPLIAAGSTARRVGGVSIIPGSPNKIRRFQTTGDGLELTARWSGISGAIGAADSFKFIDAASGVSGSFVEAPASRYFTLPCATAFYFEHLQANYGTVYYNTTQEIVGGEEHRAQDVIDIPLWIYFSNSDFVSGSEPPLRYRIYNLNPTIYANARACVYTRRVY